MKDAADVAESFGLSASGGTRGVVSYTTFDYMADSSPPKPFSIRMSEPILARLDAGARRRQEPRSRFAERLIDEGLRMEDHPGIAFRDGPAGRRAALTGGPDVWEVIETVKGTELTGEDAIAAAAEWGTLTVPQVLVAVRYYGDFRDEIDERIELNRREAERQRAAWERAREALA